jgi:nucleotide-binding universal stress UspA family protein
VLIPLDGSPLAEAILEDAIALGMLMQADYTLLQAIEPALFGYAPGWLAPGLNEEVLAQLQAAAQGYLEHVAERMRAQQLQVRTQVVLAPPAAAILEYAREQAVDLIALATHGRGGGARMLLGSVADKIVRGAGAPVLVARPHGDAVQHRTAGTSAAERQTA